MQGTAVTVVFAFLLFLTELSPWNLRLKAGAACPSLPHVEVFYPAQSQTLPCRLTCGCLSLAHKPWLSSGDILFVHLLPHSWTLLLAHHLLAHHLFLQSNHHCFLLRFTFSSSLCAIWVFSSPAFQPGHTSSPYSDSIQAGLISSVPECPIAFSTPTSPFLCPPSCPRPTAVHSHLPKREQSSTSQLNQLRYHRKACGKARVENSLNTGKKSHQREARKAEHRG